MFQIEHLENTCHPSWQTLLLKALNSSLGLYELLTTTAVYPESDNILRAFLTPRDDVKAVILGQDPYPGTFQGKPLAQGLAFSVPQDFKQPPSLRIIEQELIRYYSEDDVPKEYRNFPILKGQTKDLSTWQEQGVFLLNTALTVSPGESGSHEKVWKPFTQQILKQFPEKTIFLLWGKSAQSYKPFLPENAVVLEACHPMAQVYGKQQFVGCKHFEKVNQLLRKRLTEEVHWGSPHLPF